MKEASLWLPASDLLSNVTSRAGYFDILLIAWRQMNMPPGGRAGDKVHPWISYRQKYAVSKSWNVSWVLIKVSFIAILVNQVKPW